MTKDSGNSFSIHVFILVGKKPGKPVRHHQIQNNVLKKMWCNIDRSTEDITRVPLTFYFLFMLYTGISIILDLRNRMINIFRFLSDDLEMFLGSLQQNIKDLNCDTKTPSAFDQQKWNKWSPKLKNT